MAGSFWKEAAAALPPEVRRRHAAELAAAERYENVIDGCLEAWRVGRRLLAIACAGFALALRVMARILYAAGRRLSSTAN
jgi:hypothetical protein